MYKSPALSLQQIMGSHWFPTEGSNGYRLLIKGMPGTGKTTLGLHLLNYHLGRIGALKANELSHGLIVYFQEPPQELDCIAARFGLDFHDHIPDTQFVCAEEFEHDFPFISSWIANRDINSELCILIDGMTILKMSDSVRIHKFIISLFTKIIRSKLLLIVIAEEEITAIDNYFGHMADAVFNLTVDAAVQRHRFLEIEKMRYLDHVRGKHGFEMFKLSTETTSIFQIYPRIPTYSACSSICAQDHCNASRFHSGIQGLDRILGGNPEQGSLEEGDVLVVTAEPGTDKLGMGLSFLSPLFNLSKPDIRVTERPKGAWVSFGHSSLLRSLYREPYSRRFPSILDKLSGRDKTANVSFFHHDRSNPAVHPDRIAFSLTKTLIALPNTTTRAVVDGISTLESEFSNPLESVNYIEWISQIIRNNNAIGLIFIDLPSAFTRLGNLLMHWSEEADFIGHLRWFEINNQLSMTFALTKSRYRNFISLPHHISQVKEEQADHTMFLEDRGWPMVSMLSGQMDQIHEAKVFLKIFDQNYSSRSIHEPILGDFKLRYSSDQIFAHVFRGNPSPKHWSFRGYAGAGHSNTKVVCFKQYIIEVLKDDRRLISFPKEELDKYPLHTKSSLPPREYIESRSYSLWGLSQRYSAASQESDHSYSLPLYADLGVLCCQINKGQLSRKAAREQSIALSLDESVPKCPPKSWDEMFKLNETFKALKKRPKHDSSKPVWLHPPWIENLFAIPSLMTDIHCFFSFFLEILFDFMGSDVTLIKQSLSSIDGLKGMIASESFDNTVILLRRLVQEGVSKSPLEKVHYHNAYFSRRWFSMIDQYPVNDPKIPDIEKYLLPRSDPVFSENKNLKDRLEFSIAPLPTSDPSNSSGVSCLDFYSLGIIRGALAPETAFMFISELATGNADITRFQQRRGLPILRENWACHQDLEERILDRAIIDRILDDERYFSTFWIPNYWYIESNLNEWSRRMFIKSSQSSYQSNCNTDVSPFLASISELKDDLIQIIDRFGGDHK